MKLLLSLLLSISFITANEKQKTEEELVAEFMQLDKDVKEQKKQLEKQKREIKELDKLEKTVNELAETLGVDEK